MQETGTLTVLLIGADTPEQDALHAALHPGEELLVAGNLSIATTVLRGAAPPALIVHVLGADGLEPCRQFHRDPSTRDIPLLLVCDPLPADEERRALEAGAADLLPRPLNPRLVAARLRPHLALARRVTDIEGLVQERTHGLMEINQSLKNDSREREKVIAKADFLANYDPLTALPNRRHLMERTGNEHRRVQQDNSSMALLTLNLDRFHIVNNALGNDIGDRLLVACAERIEPCLHRADVFGRLGADEFMVLLLGEGLDWHERAEQAERVGRRMLNALGQPFEIDSHRIEVTASCGYAVYPGDGDTPNELYRRAYAALRHAKAERRNSLEGYRPQFDVRAAAQFRQEGLIRQALKDHALQLYFQPKVDLGSGRMVGAEALLRLPYPDGSCKGAAEIIALAEEAQLMEALEDEILRKAFSQAATWSSRLPEGFRIAVNLSPDRFRSRDLPEQLRQLAKSSGAHTRQLEIEITESALIGDVSGAVERLRSIRKLGFAISLDDFGTGYSSLSCLKLLPLDTLKIDQHFIRDISHDERDAAIVHAIVSLAGSMGLSTVVEGVETQEQLDCVRAQNCRVAQGYLFSPPVPAGAFEKLLDSAGLIAPTGQFPAP
ncbi:MAG TPA: EAL domain-containing protein [Solimonas sp.]|nr:EAL domain-containing protein [Solimonas sp.]